MNEEEIWSIVPDFQNFSISSKGRVKSLKLGRFLAIRVGGRGYKAVVLTEGRKRRATKIVHRLIAQAFVPNPDNYLVVNHKDGDKLNNSIENLEWTSRGENGAHGYLRRNSKKVKFGLSTVKYIQRKTQIQSVEEFLSFISDSCNIDNLMKNIANQ